MRVTQPVLERKRIDFLAEIARSARPHLARGGRLLLVISPLEQAELPACAPGLALEESRAVLRRHYFRLRHKSPKHAAEIATLRR